MADERRMRILVLEDDLGHARILQWVLTRMGYAIDLAHSLHLTPSGVTRPLAGRRERGLVEKAACPSDARETDERRRS